MFVETYGGHGESLEWRAKLEADRVGVEYDETTWSARTWMAFTTQRLSVAVQYSAAQEVAEALGLGRLRPTHEQRRGPDGRRGAWRCVIRAAWGGEDSLLATRPGHQPGYRVALSGSELRREGDAREGRGRGGTDCVGNLHTPGCDARDGGGPHALAPRVERVNGPVGGSRNPLQKSSSHLSPGKRCEATAQSALGWYRPSVGVPETFGGYRSSGVLRLTIFSSEAC
eukprot:scaffold31129_cov59-Phaeocystis_antarctica.AAC.2